MLATVATGTPAGPRRWYPSAVFDHEAHRAMQCADCHLGVNQSRTGSDDLHLPVLESCVTCHHPGGSSSASAGNSCITCHLYHDRSGRTFPSTRVSLKELASPR
jgi:hypothetical protein